MIKDSQPSRPHPLSALNLEIQKQPWSVTVCLLYLLGGFVTLLYIGVCFVLFLFHPVALFLWLLPIAVICFFFSAKTTPKCLILSFGSKTQARGSREMESST